MGNKSLSAFFTFCGCPLFSLFLLSGEQFPNLYSEALFLRNRIFYPLPLRGKKDLVAGSRHQLDAIEIIY
jgi:hypothetical protein